VSLFASHSTSSSTYNIANAASSIAKTISHRLVVVALPHRHVELYSALRHGEECFEGKGQDLRYCPGEVERPFREVWLGLFLAMRATHRLENSSLNGVMLAHLLNNIRGNLHDRQEIPPGLTLR
jgi:hypothetical protein